MRRFVNIVSVPSENRQPALRILKLRFKVLKISRSSGLKTGRVVLTFGALNSKPEGSAI
jgi:hypothetical protein